MSQQGPLPYLTFCGVEVANVARTIEYARSGLGPSQLQLGPGALCSILYRVGVTIEAAGVSDAALWYGLPYAGFATGRFPVGFDSPAIDPAPWYDPAEPGSASFLGAIMLDIKGYDSTKARTVTNRVQGLGGGTFAGQRRVPRVWKFRAALISSDDAGAEYGFRWLDSVLQTSRCDTCETCELTVRLVCPPDDGSDDTIGEWASYEVALTDGPHEVVSRAPGAPQDVMAGCRDVVIVEWTMTAGNPFLYKRPFSLVGTPTQLGHANECTDICDWLFGPPGYPVCAAVTPPARGVLGAIFTLESVSGCGPVLLEAHIDCPGSSVDEPVLQMQLSGVPAHSTVVVNCATRTITLIQLDGSGAMSLSDGQHLLDLPDGRGLEWIEVRDCDALYCVCARMAHPCSQGQDTFVSVDAQVREG